MRNFVITFLALFVILTISSCNFKQYQILFEKRAALSDSAYKLKETGLENYKIKSQDIIQLRNLQNIRYLVDETPTSISSNSSVNYSQGQTFQVNEDGTVALPVIGSTKISGLTRVEAQNYIRDLYKKTLLKDPIIELKIVNLKITILGEISKQGNYILIKDRTTLIDIIGEAGGLTEKANEKNIKIIRGNEKSPDVTIIDLNNIMEINDPRAILQNGDIIYIAQSKRAVQNDNLQNFSLILQPLALLLNSVVLIFTLSRIK